MTRGRVDADRLRLPARAPRHSHRYRTADTGAVAATHRIPAGRLSAVVPAEPSAAAVRLFGRGPAGAGA